MTTPPHSPGKARVGRRSDLPHLSESGGREAPTQHANPNRYWRRVGSAGLGVAGDGGNPRSRRSLALRSVRAVTVDRNEKQGVVFGVPEIADQLLPARLVADARMYVVERSEAGQVEAAAHIAGDLRQVGAIRPLIVPVEPLGVEAEHACRLSPGLQGGWAEKLDFVRSGPFAPKQIIARFYRPIALLRPRMD